MVKEKMELSEEEKKSIEYLKYMGNNINFNKIGYVYGNETIEQILNLIERIKKENEKLKRLMAHKNGYTEALEKDLFENCSNYVVPKSKIKEKIEELNRQDKEWTEELSEPNCDFKNIDRNLKRIKNQVDILQELESE